MGYKHPLLVEIYVELYLAQGTLDPSKFFEIVPELKRLTPVVELGQLEGISVDSSQAEVRHAAVPRVRCWSNDRARLVQLSPDLIVVNQVGEYLGWPTFRHSFDQVHEVVHQRLGRDRVRSLSLNTIDKLTRPRAGFRLGRYLNCGGHFIPSWYDDCSEACDISLGRGTLRDSGSNRQLRIAVRVDHDVARVSINAAFHDSLTNDDVVSTRLEQLHEESNETFEAVITDETRQLMNEKHHVQ